RARRGEAPLPRRLVERGALPVHRDRAGGARGADHRGSGLAGLGVLQRVGGAHDRGGPGPVQPDVVPQRDQLAPRRGDRGRGVGGGGGVGKGGGGRGGGGGGEGRGRRYGGGRDPVRASDAAGVSDQRAAGEPAGRGERERGPGRAARGAERGGERAAAGAG